MIYDYTQKCLRETQISRVNDPFANRLTRRNTTNINPNKKKYDPRVWLRQGEQFFVERLTQAFTDLNCIDRNKA